MARVSVPGWPLLVQAGVDPRVFMRNGVRPSGPQVTQQSIGLLNHSLGHRLRRHFSKSVYTAQLYNNGGGGGAVTSWRWLMRTLPNETEMRCVWSLGPALSGTPEGTPQVWLKITRDSDSTVIYDDGTSGTDSRLYYGHAITTPTNAIPNDLTQRSTSYLLDPGTLYRCEVISDYGASVQSLTAHGVVRTSLDSATDTCVDPGKFLVNEPITETANGLFLDAVESLWKEHGAAHAAWSVDAATAKTVTGTTETNLLDATTTWTASTRGFPAHTLNRHSLDTTLGGSPTYLAPVKLWVYASAAGGGTGTVRARWGTGSSYAQIASISSAGWYTSDTGIPGNADQKVDFTGLCSDGGTTVSVYQMGFFDFAP